jgi:hypothetical protein
MVRSSVNPLFSLVNPYRNSCNQIKHGAGWVGRLLFFSTFKSNRVAFHRHFKSAELGYLEPIGLSRVSSLSFGVCWVTDVSDSVDNKAVWTARGSECTYIVMRVVTYKACPVLCVSDCV